MTRQFGWDRVVAGCLAVLAASGAASAGQVSFTFSGSAASTAHSAGATFTFNDVANTVTIEIRNTIGSSHDSLGSRALTGLFWDMTPSALTYSSVTGVAGDPVYGPTSDTPTQLWAMRDDLNSNDAPFGGQFGLGAAGFNVFSNSDMLAPGGPHPQPNGLDGGILSATANAYPSNQEPMWREYVRFTFNVGSSFFSNVGGLGGIDVDNVSWQFGSGFGEPGFGGDEVPDGGGHVVPLPSAVGLATVGLLAVGARRRRSCLPRL